MDIIEYLTFFFDCEYRTIDLHRSAISAFHEYTDGLLVGKIHWCLVYLNQNHSNLQSFAK